MPSLTMLDGIIDSMDMSLNNWEIVKDRKTGMLYIQWGCKELDTTEQLNSDRQYTLM